jgi:hypothetical protein
VNAPFEVVIEGLARDGVSSVQFLMRDGSSMKASVIDNVFRVTEAHERAENIIGYLVNGTRYSWPMQPERAG